MKSAEVTLSAPTGLHARPAGELVKLVKGLEGSKVTITCGERSVNAASMLSLLSLGIKSGTALVVCVDGGEEAAALEAVVKFIESIKE